MSQRQEVGDSESVDDNSKSFSGRSSEFQASGNSTRPRYSQHRRPSSGQDVPPPSEAPPKHPSPSQQERSEEQYTNDLSAGRLLSEENQVQKPPAHKDADNEHVQQGDTETASALTFPTRSRSIRSAVFGDHLSTLQDLKLYQEHIVPSRTGKEECAGRVQNHCSLQAERSKGTLSSGSARGTLVTRRIPPTLSTDLPSKPEKALGSVPSRSRSHHSSQVGAYAISTQAPGPRPQSLNSEPTTNNPAATQTNPGMAESAEASSSSPAAPSARDQDPASDGRISLVNATKIPVLEVESERTTVIPRAEASGEEKARKLWILVTLSMLLVAVAVIIPLSVKLSNQESQNDTHRTSPSSAPVWRSTLETILDRGVLRCGLADGRRGLSYVDPDTGRRTGFMVDLCRAVAAAALGDPELVEDVIVNATSRFPTLASGSVDLLSLSTTHTMERDIAEPFTGLGYTFTAPFLYDGLRIAGDPFFVECANNLTISGDCEDLSICVLEGTTHFSVLSDVFPQTILVLVADTGVALAERQCKVMAEGVVPTSEVIVRDLGYMGNYTVGSKVFLKEPLALVTREDDVRFSDFVNWVLLSLFLAESRNITRASASSFPLPRVFGEGFEDMFVNAIGAVGNYGEIYKRHLESIVPREGLNLYNTDGGSGLIYSHPFGEVDGTEVDPAGDDTLSQIFARGVIRCGVSTSSGFAMLDDMTQEWVGLEAEYCSALSAAVFGGEGDRVEFVDFSGPDELSRGLTNGTIDVIGGIRVGINADVAGLGSGEGLSFSQPYLYGPLTANGNSLRFGEALAVATLGKNRRWSDFCYWVVSSSFYAEESNLGQDATSNQLPSVGFFGPSFERMLKDAVLEVGSYRDMYNRSILPPRSGRNLLNSEPFGPQIWAVDEQFVV